MPYRVQPDGNIVCDTVDEAIELRDRLMAVQIARAMGALPKAESAPTKPKNGHTPEAKALPELVASMPEPQRNALHFIKVMGEATLDDLRLELNLTENKFAVAGVVSAIGRNLEKAGFAPEEVLQREEAGSGKNRVVTYRPGPGLEALNLEVFNGK